MSRCCIEPGTPAGSVQHLLDMADLICVMTVNPGFGGQKFIDMTDKVRALRSMIGDRPVHIEIDGVDQIQHQNWSRQAQMFCCWVRRIQGGSVTNPRCTDKTWTRSENRFMRK